MVLYLKGAAEKGLKNFQEAKNYLKKVLDIPEKEYEKEKHVLPYSCIVLGELAMDQKNVCFFNFSNF
jgi:hypothetical protein